MSIVNTLKEQILVRLLATVARLPSHLFFFEVTQFCIFMKFLLLNTLILWLMLW